MGPSDSPLDQLTQLSDSVESGQLDNEFALPDLSDEHLCCSVDISQPLLDAAALLAFIPDQDQPPEPHHLQQQQHHQLLADPGLQAHQQLPPPTPWPAEALSPPQQAEALSPPQQAEALSPQQGSAGRVRQNRRRPRNGSARVQVPAEVHDFVTATLDRSTAEFTRLLDSLPEEQRAAARAHRNRERDRARQRCARIECAARALQLAYLLDETADGDLWPLVQTFMADPAFRQVEVWRQLLRSNRDCFLRAAEAFDFETRARLARVFEEAARRSN